MKTHVLKFYIIVQIKNSFIKSIILKLVEQIIEHFNFHILVFDL